MLKETSIQRIECPACGHRICDKEEGASGSVRQKCIKCKRIWRVNLSKNQLNLIGGKALLRREGACTI